MSHVVSSPVVGFFPRTASQSATDSTSYWSTEGTGSCATGNFTCNSSGRQIGCNATGDYVKCEYTVGDVGWVKCYGHSNDGTTAAFEDQCP